MSDGAQCTIGMVHYVYRCLGCLEVFSSQKSAQVHDKKCKLVGYFTVTLDEFLKGRKT